MLLLQNISYTHPDKDLLFESISMSLGRQDKAALVGNNGAGKSTLLRIMAGILPPSEGTVTATAKPYYIPQLFGQYNDLTIAGALQVKDKLQALKAILEGDVSEANLLRLDDDWTIEERCNEALQHWQLSGLDLEQPLSALSGGQKTRVFLAGISIHQPQIVLLDEPSNHLDAAGRRLLYDFIRAFNGTLVVVSHDRTLLNLLPAVYELDRHDLTLCGGNYDFYAAQKKAGLETLQQEVKQAEKALRKARETERETAERQQKLDARGRKKQEKAGLPTISMNTFRNNAEKSTARAKNMHAEKTGGMARDLDALRKSLPDPDKMKLGFDDTDLHKGKILFKGSGINYSYNGSPVWVQPLDIEIRSGERIALNGGNGAGKTTLIRLLLGQIKPATGTAYSAISESVYIDQDYSLINNLFTVQEQALAYNKAQLQPHEVNSRLSHFLFTPADWNKPCAALSGGEKMRLILCCLTLNKTAPDMIVMDEPTNNLDISNIEILTAAVQDYKGTLILVSHDSRFLEETGVERTLVLTHNEGLSEL